MAALTPRCDKYHDWSLPESTYVFVRNWDQVHSLKFEWPRCHHSRVVGTKSHPFRWIVGTERNGTWLFRSGRRPQRVIHLHEL